MTETSASPSTFDTKEARNNSYITLRKKQEKTSIASESEWGSSPKQKKKSAGSRVPSIDDRHQGTMIENTFRSQDDYANVI